MVKLAIVGDIHGAWTSSDARWFEGAGYDRVVVVGDLAGLRWSRTLAVAAALGEMSAPALVIPGNHDATHPAQLLAEVIGAPSLGDPLAAVQRRRLDALRAALGDHSLCAYSTHRVGDLTLIAGRPHSMGGPTLSFPAHLAAVWGVSSLRDSADRLCALVDDAPTDRLVFVGHNGPAGLGATRDAIWGCDFRKAQGDWGDPDLEEAIAHARRVGKQVLAVCAGHMHRRLKGRGRRTWRVVKDGTVYLNAAEVPRICRKRGTHHHVALTIDGDRVIAEDQHVEPG